MSTDATVYHHSDVDLKEKLQKRHLHIFFFWCGVYSGRIQQLCITFYQTEKSARSKSSCEMFAEDTRLL